MAESRNNAVPMRALLAGARKKQRELIELSQAFVEIESPSDDKSAVDRCIALAFKEAKARRGRVKLHRQKNHGNLLEARFGPRSKSGRILLLGHLDTVWPIGTLKTMPWRMRDGRLWGPGVLDMKAGAAMAFIALDLLAEAELLDREIILLLNSEEEIGSPASRPVTERLARECAAVFVLEPAQGLAYKTARKGTGDWRIEIKGVAAHAGVDFEKGANAIHELARLIETVSGWSDLKRGLTVSVGVTAGGTKTNVIPAEAWAEVDVRIARAADGPRITHKFDRLKTKDRRCSLALSGGINRPPMERSKGTVALFRQAKELAAEIGIVLHEAATGGASDGNFTAALGVPTLDGMGAVGEGAHAHHESVVVERLAERIALLAGMICRA